MPATVEREGRIEARRLSNGRVEFGFRPEGGERILPERRFFPPNARTGRWLVSSDVASDGDVIGQITARLLDNGRIEFGFNPVEGERILPAQRFFPTSARTDRWLVSSAITIPIAAAAPTPQPTATPTATPTPAGKAVTGEVTTCSGKRRASPLNDWIDVTITATVNVHRSVSFLTARATANGKFITFESIGPLSAGQSRSLNLSGFFVDASATRLECDIKLEWREAGQ